MKTTARFPSFLCFGLLLTLIGFASQAQAQNQFGIGAMLGDPSGISGKVRLNQNAAVDGLFAYSSGPADTYYLAASYQIEKPRFHVIDGQALDFYYGLGFRLYEGGPKDKRKTHLGPKVPVGLRTQFQDPPVEVFGEASFIMDLTPSTSGDVDAGIGARYWF